MSKKDKATRDACPSCGTANVSKFSSLRATKCLACAAETSHSHKVDEVPLLERLAWTNRWVTKPWGAATRHNGIGVVGNLSLIEHREESSCGSV